MKNRAKKLVVKALKKVRELSEHLNKVFKLVKSMKKDGLNFSEKDRRKSTWKELSMRRMSGIRT